MPVYQQFLAARRVAEDLLLVAGAARHARNVVTDACIRWNLTALAPAALIISELVGNVVDHAHTIMTVEISLQPSCLYLAVRDGGGASPALRHIDGASDARGRGLQPVAAFSSDWGYIADETARPCGQHCPCLVPRRPALRQGRNRVRRHVDGHRPDDGVPTRPGRW